VTGNGLKTMDALVEKVSRPDVIDAKIGDFDTLLEQIKNRGRQGELVEVK
jgi:hypothetical protein